jgi:hypothetical protein
LNIHDAEILKPRYKEFSFNCAGIRMGFREDLHTPYTILSPRRPEAGHFVHRARNSNDKMGRGYAFLQNGNFFAVSPAKPVL